MLRAMVLLAATAVPASAQVSAPPAAQVSLQFTQFWARGDDGTVQGVGGSGIALRFGVRPLASRSHLRLEGALTYIPESHPHVWAGNVGALYSLAPIGSTRARVNPFAAVAVGGDLRWSSRRSECVSDRGGCMDESPDLHGTRPSITLGAGSWMTVHPRIALRLDLRAHHRFGGGDAEAAWSPEFSAGLGYHF